MSKYDSLNKYDKYFSAVGNECNRISCKLCADILFILYSIHWKDEKKLSEIKALGELVCVHAEKIKKITDEIIHSHSVKDDYLLNSHSIMSSILEIFDLLADKKPFLDYKTKVFNYVNFFSDQAAKHKIMLLFFSFEKRFQIVNDVFVKASHLGLKIHDMKTSLLRKKYPEDEHLFKKRQKSPQIQKKLVINNKTVYLAVHFNLDWAYFRGNLKNKISDCMNSSSYNDSEKEILNGLNKLSFEEILQLILNMYVNTILLTLKKNDSLLRASKVNLYILLADSSGRSGAFTKAVSNFSNYFITYVVDITDFLSYYSLKMSYFTGSVYTTIGHELIHACDWQLSLEQPNSYLIATKLIGSNPSNELILLVNLLCNLRSEGFAEVGSIITEWVSKKRLQSYDLSFSINTFFNKNGEKIKNFFDTNSLNNNFENLKVVSKQFYEAGALHYFGEAIVYLMLINYLRDELVYYNDYLNKTIISSINKESVESIVSGMTRVGYKNRVLFNDLKNCLSSATDLHLLMPISAYSKANIFLKKLSLMNIIVFLKTFISACKTLELSYYPFTVNVLNELDSAAKKKRKAFLKKEGFDE